MVGVTMGFIIVVGMLIEIVIFGWGRIIKATVIHIDWGDQKTNKKE
jgi:hypothetical protein